MMAFLRPARAGPERSVEEAAEVAALTQFRLIQMLSTDRRALATARLLGLPLGERDKKVQQAADCRCAARSTAPASPFARFPTSGEESELRESLRTHSRTFGAAGQVLGCGPNDPTAAVVHLVLADLAPRGADV